MRLVEQCPESVYVAIHCFPDPVTLQEGVHFPRLGADFRAIVGSSSEFSPNSRVDQFEEPIGWDAEGGCGHVAKIDQCGKTSGGVGYRYLIEEAAIGAKNLVFYPLGFQRNLHAAIRTLTAHCHSNT